MRTDWWANAFFLYHRALGAKVDTGIRIAAQEDRALIIDAMNTLKDTLDEAIPRAVTSFAWYE
jgi:hypothetical protein